jgi:hypothetical protein
MSEFFFPAPPDQPPLVLEPGDTIEVVFAEADESPVFTGIAPRVVGGYVVDANGKLIDRYGVCDQPTTSQPRQVDETAGNSQVG